jgi:hypothetical protein
MISSATLRTSLHSLLLGGIALATAQPAWSFQQPVGTSTTSTGSTGVNVMNAPEIDPTLATGLVVLLAGGVLILTSRVRRARATSS